MMITMGGILTQYPFLHRLESAKDLRFLIPGGSDRYEAAWETIQAQNAGRPHPAPEVLANVFGVPDRVAAYQGRPRDAIAGLLSWPDAGAQMSFSGALVENVQSLAAAEGGPRELPAGVERAVGPRSRLQTSGAAAGRVGRSPPAGTIPSRRPAAGLSS